MKKFAALLLTFCDGCFPLRPVPETVNRLKQVPRMRESKISAESTTPEKQ